MSSIRPEGSPLARWSAGRRSSAGPCPGGTASEVDVETIHFQLVRLRQCGKLRADTLHGRKTLALTQWAAHDDKNAQKWASETSSAR